CGWSAARSGWGVRPRARAITCCATGWRPGSLLKTLPTYGEPDVGHRVVLVLVDLVLHALTLGFELRLYGAALRPGAVQSDLRRTLEHDAEVEVEVDALGPDVAVTHAEVGREAVLGFHGAAQGGARQSQAAAGDAKRPERVPVEQQAAGQHLDLRVVAHVAGVEVGIEVYRRQADTP